MEKVEETLTLGVSIILSEICEQLLTKSVKKEDGTIALVDRTLPFRLRYRLTRNKTALDRDVEFFNKQRMLYLAQYGEITEDDKNVVIKDPQKLELYKRQVQNLFDTKVTHNLIKLDEEDIDQVRDIDINLTSDALGIFIGYMTNDTALLEDLSRGISVTPTFKEFKPENTETVTSQEVKDTAVDSALVLPPKKKSSKKKASTEITTPEEVKPAEETIITEATPAKKPRTTKKKTEQPTTETLSVSTASGPVEAITASTANEVTETAESTVKKRTTKKKVEALPEEAVNTEVTTETKPAVRKRTTKKTTEEQK